MTLDLDLRLNPYPMYAEMRKHAPVVHNPQFGAWLLYRYEDVRRVLADHQTFSSAVFEGIASELIVEHSIQSMDQPRHTQLRALATHAFTPRAIAELEPRIRQIAEDLLDRALQKEQFDFVRDFAVPFPVTVIAEMLGVPAKDMDRFKHWSDAIVESSERLIVGIMEELPEHLEAYRQMRAFFRQLVGERRETPQADLISRLAHAETAGQRLTDAEVVDFCLLLMVAGNETTTNLVSNAMRAFLENPDQWELLCEAPQLVPQAVEEVLRYYSPAQCLFRVVKQDVEIGGHQIRAGERVAVFMGSANRDEAHLENADRFDVTRPTSPHVALSHGIHFCLGAPLARLEAKIALQVLIDRLHSFRLPEGANLEPLATFIVFGLRNLPLQVACRQPA